MLKAGRARWKQMFEWMGEMEHETEFFGGEDLIEVMGQ